MIFVRITEGFGNQLFKYACAFAVAMNSGDDICIDTSGYAFRSRGYMLDKLNISGKVGDFPVPANDGKVARMFAKSKRWCLINKTGKCKVVKEDKATWMRFADYDFSYKKNIYIEGYWQNPGYFDKYHQELGTEFSPKQGALSAECEEWINQVRNSDSVAVHIRRGDYPQDWLLDIGFYDRAIEAMKVKHPDAAYYLFCEDKDYAKSFACKYPDVKIVSELHNFTDIEEFYFMSACKHQIIANSTFSWWAAYLNRNPNKIVIAPDYMQWTGDYYPDSWMAMKAEAE